MARKHVETIVDHPQTLYRGLQIPLPNDVPRALADPERFVKENLNADQMGIHWTDNYNSAWNFANGYDAEGWAPEVWDDEGEDPNMGFILHSRVQPRHIVQPGTDEWEDYAMGDSIFDHDHPEQEVTVRDRSPVNLDAVEVLHGPETVATVGDPWAGSSNRRSWYHGRA